MNKFLIAITQIAITITLISVQLTLSANVDARVEKLYENTAPKYSVQDVKERLSNLSSIIDINYTPEVGRRIKEYTVNYRKAGERILGRVDLYFPLFDAELDAMDLPEDIKYIAVVESNLEPTAKSKSGASGLWQFIKSTGRMQGLVINNYIDERNDPKKSTKAALEYLSYLYDSFGDWTLAFAAYNCGPGNVRKAIRRGGSKDYWSIRKHLPNETQKYVPRIIAAMYLLKYYHAHDLQPRLIDEDIRRTVKIQDGIGHNFYKLSQALDMDYNTLRYLNPTFKTKSFPKNDGHLTLVIPSSRERIYLATYQPKIYAAMMAAEEKRRVEQMELVKAEIKPQPKPQLNPLEKVRQKVYNKIYSREETQTNISL